MTWGSEVLCLDRLGAKGGRTDQLSCWAGVLEAEVVALCLYPGPSLIFGIITCLTGVLGVGLGVEISRRLRHSNPRGDPLVCAAGLLGSAPFLFLALVCARGSIVATYVSSQQGARGCSGFRVGEPCTGVELGSPSGLR